MRTHGSPPTQGAVARCGCPCHDRVGDGAMMGKDEQQHCCPFAKEFWFQAAFCRMPGKNDTDDTAPRKETVAVRNFAVSVCRCDSRPALQEASACTTSNFPIFSLSECLC